MTGLEASWGVFFVLVLVIALLAFWVYFMMTKLKVSRHQELIERQLRHMDRVEALLEEIAANSRPGYDD